MEDALYTQTPLVLESGTGSGKTICAVSSTISFAMKNNKKIIYATRTNAQQKQVISEVRRIKKMFPTENITAIGLQGRSHMCLLVRDDPELQKGTADELARFCAEEKKKIRKGKKGGCRYFRNIVRDEDTVNKTLLWMNDFNPTAEELTKYCEEKECCPYEINKIFVQDALLVVVPYIYVFDTNLRNMLLDWMGVSEEDIILVIDEAHNLPDYLRDLLSSQLSVYMLNSCIYETERFGDPFLLSRSLSVSKFADGIRDVILDLRSKFLLRRNELIYGAEKNDALLSPDGLISNILERFSISMDDLNKIISALIAYGEQIRDAKQKDGKLPRSYIYKLGEFLSFWMSVDDERYIKLIVDSINRKNPRVETYCLDPSVGASIVNRFFTSIHMSGTLSPLSEYRDSLGLPPSTMLFSYPSPFPRRNRKILYINSVTTKYNELRDYKGNIERLERYIKDISNSTDRNTIIFFPSFDLMSLFIKRGILDKIKRGTYVEKQSMNQSSLMDIVVKFKENKIKGSILFSVIGGRLSEGMDFPAEELEIAVIVGIPYPKPTARQRGLQRYYQKKFGKGWEYTVQAPTARKLLQAIGRLIRNETDRGVAVILDKRALRFKKYLRDIELSRDIIKDIRKFILEEDLEYHL